MKIDEKTGQLVGKKIYDKFKTKAKPFRELVETKERDLIDIEETKGKEITEILKTINGKKIDKYQYIKDIYNDLM